MSWHSVLRFDGDDFIRRGDTEGVALNKFKANTEMFILYRL